MNDQPHCFLAELPHESLLRIRGPEASKFLQGQVTCDTRRLSAEQAMPGAYCTPQGRVVCDFLLAEHEPEHLLLRMRQSILEASAATFGKYIVFSRAEIATDTDQWRILGCWGPDAAAVLEQLLPRLPADDWQAVSGPGFTVVALPGARFEIYLHGEPGQALDERLRQLSTTGDAADWIALEIRSGIARIEAETAQMFIPQMLNYDLSGHIRFDKGCYTGQEVVARLHYRGKPKRRLYTATAVTGALPAPGDALYTTDSPQASGNVVNAIADDQDPDRSLMLATLTVATADRGSHLQDADGPTLELGEHPYMAAFDEQEP